MKRRDFHRLLAAGAVLGPAAANARPVTSQAVPTASPAPYRSASPFENLRAANKVVSRNLGFADLGLRTVTAIFRTGAGLDGQKRAQLDGIPRLMFAVNALCTEEKLGQRQVMQGPSFGYGPFGTG